MPSGSSKWSKADISRWKCENCVDDEPATPVGASALKTLSRQRSAVFNDSDAGSETGHSSVSLDHREVSKRLIASAAANSVTSTRTGRVVKKPKSFEETEVDPTKYVAGYSGFRGEAVLTEDLMISDLQRRKQQQRLSRAMEIIHRQLA